MTETKEAMQNTIKNLQAKSEYINKLEDKGSKALVLQLGSHTLKMGFANEKAPFTIRPFIAYQKTKRQVSKEEVNNSKELFDYEYFKTEYQKLQERLKIEGVVAPDNRTLKGKPRAKQTVNVERLPPFDPTAEVLYGEQALWVQNDPNYEFRKPLSYGFFNVPCEKQEKDFQSFQRAIDDLYNILEYMLKQILKIPIKEWKNFSCVIIVPDIFIRKHVKYLLQRIFKSICFRRIYLHIQSVLACFATSVSSACVVDIGHEKINICCVDEGIVVPQTLLRKNYGLKHISKGLCKIFAERVSDKEIGQVRFDREADLSQIDKMKELSTAIRDPDESINRVYEVCVPRKMSSMPFQVSYSDSICVIANSIFSQMWNCFENQDGELDQFNLNSQCFDLYQDPQDYFEQFSGGGHIYQINGNNNQDLDPAFYDPWVYQPLDELVMVSLNSIKDKDLRRRYYNNILVVGGGGHMLKLNEEIVLKLNNRLGLSEDNLDKVELASDLFMKQTTPIHASWLGGTVIPKLDSLRDLWIEKSKFMGEMPEQLEQEQQQNYDKRLFTRKEQSQQWGVSYLKEKVPFIW